MKIIPLLRVFALLLTVLPMALQAQFPQRINDGGRVGDGTTNFNGSGQFKFALIDAAGPTNHLSNNGSSVSGSQPTAAVPLTRTKRLDSVLLGEISLPNMMNVIRRDSFSIRQGEVVRFTQPGTSSELLIIVTGDLPTEIAGRLLSNGRVSILNPNGILVGSSGVVDACGGFLATTRNPPGDRLFGAPPAKLEGPSGASVSTAGRILACHGDVSLIGHTVENHGTITSSNVLLASGKGQTKVSGSVSAANARQGGRIDIAGGTVEVSSRARIDASGTRAGGSVRIGGGLRGDDGEIANARTTTIAGGAVISANARDCGGGGSVIVWADGATSFHGHISARGGNDGGDGGFAEVSGKQWLGFSGTVDLKAPKGDKGTLLLDPTNLEIKGGPSVPGDVPTVPPGPNKIDGKSTLSWETIKSALANGNLVVTTNSAGADAGNITVSASPVGLLSSGSLTLTANGSITINSAIVNGGSGNLIFNAPGGITLGANVSTGGSQTYNGAVTLWTNTILAGSAVTFASTITGAANNLRLNAPVTIVGNVLNGGAASGVKLFTAGGNANVQGSATFAGSYNFINPVTLWADTILTGSAVTFGSFMTGANNDLRINAPVTIVGNTINGGAVSGVKLFTAGGNANVQGTTTFADSYNFINPVTLAGHWTVTGTPVTFSSTVTGAFGLTANSGGSTTFGGAVSIESLLTNAGGSTAINTANVTTTGNQTYNGSVTTSGAITLNAGAGSITAENANNNFTGVVTLIATGALVSVRDINALTLAVPTLGANTGITAIAGTTLTLPAMGFSTGTGSINFRCNGGALTTPGWLVTTSGSITLLGSAGLTVAHSIISTSGPVSLTGGGVAVNAGLTVNNGNSTILVDGNDGAISLGGALSTTNPTATAVRIIDATTAVLGNITTGAAGTVVLGETAGDSLSGAVTQTGIISAGTLTGSANSTVSLTEPNTITNLGAFSSNGTFQLNDSGGVTVTTTPSTNGGSLGVFTTGDLSFSNPLVLPGNTTLKGISLALAGGTITGSAKDLTLDIDTAFNLTNAISGVAKFTSQKTINVTGAFTTTGSQTYNASVTLTGNSVLDAGSGAITFNSRVNGEFSLTANTTGATTFGGAVGGNTPLASLTTNVGGTTAINGGAVTTTGGQTYNGAVTLGTNTALLGTSLTLGGGLAGGGSNLTIDFSTPFTLPGGIANVANLTAQKAVILSGDFFTTGGSQTYNGAVTLGANVVVASTGNSAISFNSTVNGAFGLTVTTSGLTTFGGAVGGTAALTSLTTNAGGTTAINGGSITTMGAPGQVFNEALTLGADTTLNAGAAAITFVTTLDSFDAPARSLTANTTGLTTFGGAVGGTRALSNLATSHGGTTRIAGLVATTGSQTFFDPVTLTGNGELIGTELRTDYGIAGADNDLRLKMTTPFELTGGIAGVRHFVSDLAIYARGTFATTGNQLYKDSVTLVGTSTFHSTGSGSISFESSLGGGQGLTVNTAGTTVFGGNVGSLGWLTTNAGGSTRISGQVVTAGTQTFGDAVTLTGNCELIGTELRADFGITGAGNDLRLYMTTPFTLPGGIAGVRNFVSDMMIFANGNFATTGNQLYKGWVVLEGTSTFGSTGAGSISFESRLDGGRSLTVNTAGTTTFGGAVGDTTALASLTTDAGGLTRINGGSVTTLGLQFFNDEVVLGTATTLNANVVLVAPAASISGSALQIARARLYVDGSSIGDSTALQLGTAAVVEVTGTEIVEALFMDGVQMSAGTHGSSMSAAQFKNDTRFVGTGVVLVTSDPAPVAYANWASIHAPSGGPGDDFDDDGVANAVEYILGGTKNTHDLGKLPVATTPNGNFVVTFTRDKASKSGDAAVTIEVGANLAVWSAVFNVGDNTAGSSPGVTITGNGNGTDTVTLTLTRAPHSARFARLAVLPAW